MLQNIRRSTQNIVVGYLESISAGGEGAESVYTFVVEALKVGRVGVTEIIVYIRVSHVSASNGKEGDYG
jgi:hypothetical protein